MALRGTTQYLVGGCVRAITHRFITQTKKPLGLVMTKRLVNLNYTSKGSIF